MNNVFCTSCKRMVVPGPYCDSCGAPLQSSQAQSQPNAQVQHQSQPPTWQQHPTAYQQPTKKPIPAWLKITGIGCAGLFAMFVVLAIIGALMDKKNPESKPSTPTASAPSSTSPAATPSPAPSSAPTPAPPSDSTVPPPSPQEATDTQAQQRAKESAEHFAEAKKALADGYKPTGKDRSWGRVKDARQHLEQIQPTDKEYAEAQRLIQEVGRREAEIEKWAQAFARQYYSDELEKVYLSKGMDVEVSVSGTDNTTIKLKYVLMSRPLVYQMTNDSSVTGKLRELGFKKIIFTDGYRNTWTHDL